jgi:hypothetical protein
MNCYQGLLQSPVVLFMHKFWSSLEIANAAVSFVCVFERLNQDYQDLRISRNDVSTPVNPKIGVQTFAQS